jgi:type II secretion system (T2SS) protein N
VRSTPIAVWVLLALVAAAIAFAPAALVDGPLAAKSAQRLRLADASGFWWNGRGTLATSDGVARVPVAWRTEFLPLARGTLVLQLAGGNDAASGTITLGPGRTSVRALHVSVPAAAATALDPRLQPLALGGSVTLDAPSLVADSAGRSGSLAGEWRRARIVAGPRVLELGTVTVVAAAGERFAGTIRNSGGDVALDGSFAERAGALEATLVLRPSSSAPEDVRALVQSLGAPDGAGGVRTEWRSNG